MKIDREEELEFQRKDLEVRKFIDELDFGCPNCGAHHAPIAGAAVRECPTVKGSGGAVPKRVFTAEDWERHQADEAVAFAAWKLYRGEGGSIALVRAAVVRYCASRGIEGMAQQSVKWRDVERRAKK